MKIFLIALMLALSSTLVVEGLFLGGLGILAVKAGILGGIALSRAGRRRTYYSYRPSRRYYSRRRYYRYRRSVEDEEDNEAAVDDLIIQADLADVDDCAKMFLCELNSKDAVNMDKIETVAANMFGSKIDLSAPSVRFDLAAMTGREVGVEQCKLLYGRCKVPYGTLLKVFEKSALGQSPLPLEY